MAKQKFRIEIRPSVEKDLLKINIKFHRLIWNKIEHFADEHFPQGCKKLQGSDKHYRIRVGMYRIIYEVSSELTTVYVQRVKPRSKAYKKK